MKAAVLCCGRNGLSRLPLACHFGERRAANRTRCTRFAAVAATIAITAAASTTGRAAPELLHLQIPIPMQATARESRQKQQTDSKIVPHNIASQQNNESSRSKATHFH
jgi:hypothetical protein